MSVGSVNSMAWMTGSPHWAARSLGAGLLDLSALVQAWTTDSMYESIFLASAGIMLACRDLIHVLTVCAWPDLGASLASGLTFVEQIRASSVVGRLGDPDAEPDFCFLLGVSGMLGSAERFLVGEADA